MSSTVLSDISFGLGFLSSFGQQVDVVGIFANGPSTGAQQPASPTSSIINSITGNTAPQAAFGQMFANARPLKATIRETSKIMEHPVETGVMLADHHIINPIEIDLPLIISSQYYAQTFSQIRQAFINATLLSIKTRVGIYSNMIIVDLPHEEAPEMYDSITVGLHLRQVIYVLADGTIANNFQPIDPLNSNTILSGLQQAVALGANLSHSAASISSYAGLGRFL